MKKHKWLLIGMGITTLIYVAITLWGEYLLAPGDESGYYFLSFYILAPLTAVATGLFLGVKRVRFLWCYPALVGVLGLIMPITAFGSLYFRIAFLEMGFAVLGVLIGIYIHSYRMQKQEKIE